MLLRARRELPQFGQEVTRRPPVPQLKPSETSMRKIGPAQALFALSLAALAVLSTRYGNFAPLIAATALPAKATYVFATLLVAACAGLFVSRTVAVSAITIAICALGWAAVTIPPIAHAPLSVGSWFGLSEAMSTLVGVWTLYALDRRRDHAASAGAMTGDGALRLGRILFGGACLVFGISHFAYAAYSLPYVPTWLPARLSLVYITGACHVAAGVGLILGVLPRLAAMLQAVMIVLFGLLVWLPSHFANPVPQWAGSPQNQWSETFLNFVLAAVAWMIADSLRSQRQSDRRA